MKRKKLGKQGPEISVIGFGAWEAGGEHYGPNPSEDEVIEPDALPEALQPSWPL